MSIPIVETPLADVISPNMGAFRSCGCSMDEYFFYKYYSLSADKYVDIVVFTPGRSPARQFEYTAADGIILRKVPSQYATLQGAVDASNSGDIVLIADGVHTGTGFQDVRGRGKTLTILSENGPFSCIMDGGGASLPWMRLNEAETSDFAVSGFSVRGFNSSAVRLEDSSCTVKNCIFTGCYNGIEGYSTTATPIELRCANVVSAFNNAPNVGGGASLTKCQAVFTNCVIMNNTSGSPALGGAGIAGYDSVDATAVNTIVWGNRSANAEVPVDEQQIGMYVGSSIAATYSDIQVGGGSPVWPGTGNIKADPLIGGDWRTADGSLCRGAGTIEGQSYITSHDLYGNYRTDRSGSIDMGVFESGGIVKPSLIRMRVVLSGRAVSSPVSVGFREDAKTTFVSALDRIRSFQGQLENPPSEAVRAFSTAQADVGSVNPALMSIGRDVSELSGSLGEDGKPYIADTILLSGSAVRLRITNTDTLYGNDVSLHVRWLEIDKSLEYEV